MPRAVGVLVAKEIVAGLVEGHRLVGELHRLVGAGQQAEALRGVPADEIARSTRQQIQLAGAGEPVAAIGVAFPGIILDGIVQECPNLQQVKGFNLQAALAGALGRNGDPVPVRVYNDADATAAGIAATRGHLDRLIRVWTLVDGIGFGRYPWSEGAWEGGHSVVTLDPKEHFCGCGGRGHLEGIMGHHAMRLRFLDMEPEEVFANAKVGDTRCEAFVKMWHRALAAATATSIHMEGPGKFFITGFNAKFVELGMLNRYVHEMVKMSPLQGSLFEVISTSDEIGVIGAAVNAQQAI